MTQIELGSNEPFPVISHIRGEPGIRLIWRLTTENLSNVLVVKWYLSVVKLLTTDKCTLWKYNFGNFIFKTFILKLKFYFYLNRYYTWSMAMPICFIWILKLGPFSKFILTFEWVFIFIWILLIIQWNTLYLYIHLEISSK